MKRFVVLLITAIFFFAPWSIVAGAEMVKEGEGTLKTSQSATYKALRMGKERTELQYEVTGFVVEAPENSPLYNATWYGLGGMHMIQGAYDDRGFVRYTRPDGDQVFCTHEAQKKPGGERIIKLTFVGGTGKCAGITGGGELKGISLPPATEGILQSMSIGKFNWKIP